MPMYEYHCSKCGHQFEVIQKFSDRLKTKCPKCGGLLEKLLSAPAIQFKGAGWYVTDYGKGGAAGTNEKASDKPATGDKGTASSQDKPKAEPKPEPKKKGEKG